MDFVKRKELVLVLTAAAAVTIEVQNQLATNGTTPDWRSLIVVAAGALARKGVWSQASHEQDKQG